MHFVPAVRAVTAVLSWAVRAVPAVLSLDVQAVPAVLSLDVQAVPAVLLWTAAQAAKAAVQNPPDLLTTASLLSAEVHFVPAVQAVTDVLASVVPAEERLQAAEQLLQDLLTTVSLLWAEAPKQVQAQVPEQAAESEEE